MSKLVINNKQHPTPKTHNNLQFTLVQVKLRFSVLIKPQQFIFNYKFSISWFFFRKMLSIYEKHPSFACIYTKSFALIRESYALTREKYNFFLYENELNRLSYESPDSLMKNSVPSFYMYFHYVVNISHWTAIFQKWFHFSGNKS